MPLILAENEATESGIEYADKTGIQYQYPKQYKNRIQPGERFIYYRGRKTSEKSRAPQVYFGSGIIGDVSEDPEGTGRLICSILDYSPFEKPIPFKIGKDDYLESGGSRRGYYQQGVRKVSEEDFQRILSHSNSQNSNPLEVRETLSTYNTYATPETARRVEEYAVKAAIAYLSGEDSTWTIREMPRNNPGFDILLSKGTEKRYIEVKGTQKFSPTFFMSDGELRFSRSMSDHYTLLVFYKINLEEKTHSTFLKHGAITADVFKLDPTQWSITAK